MPAGGGSAEMATSSRSYDAIVIGAGHNGLVTAGLLARAGMSVVVLERSGRAGGALATSELEPGVRVPTVAHTVGRLRESVLRDLRLGQHGLELIRPNVRAFAPQPDGAAITLYADPVRTAEELRPFSKRDAGAYPGFDRKVRALGSWLAWLNVSTPPHLKSPSMNDAVAGLRLAKAFRGLGSKERVREAIRVLPMAAADFVAEAFETPGLRGAIAARAVQYTAMGPWSAGTLAVLLNDSATPDAGAAGQTVFARGGPGALADALTRAAHSFGAEIRTSAEVAQITTSGGRVTGAVLGDGDDYRAPVVASGADPRRTLLGLLDPVVLGPNLSWRAANLRLPGVVSKVNLALSGLPRFTAAAGEDEYRLGGRIVVAPSVDYLERAFDASKYGQVSEHPYLEATIQSLSDPSLAPEGRHVMSVLMQWTPYRLRNGEWSRQSEKDALADTALATLEEYAPGISALVTSRQVITPSDLERDFGLTEGNPFHGEPGLDQFFAWRPLLGHARYRMPVEGLYLCGSGAHPGGGVTGAPGANAAREILGDRKAKGRTSRTW